ncbi:MULTISPECIES: FAD/NAD(P)-binding protein [unclassified Shinella]|uniref:FAD/NAD(P)-binding protein n=1 Tax=unclassified Shinella TaxID=2643062 RepID=UPI00234EAA04|nr:MULTISPECIES: FAD/NAD(P)-binding protein [unclassified Shinella]MCO5151428.1 FAD/NAD(P)-binding protein [Shinella sp.]MDC7266309.1 FAD/NAD(P)-binding protein [Shinella sp. HY16]MDC7273206.1 FAD/NAD(P)-binding protein [Shinella sp. YZ44]
MSTSSFLPVVAIVGGGFSGAAVAYHLARALPAHAARIVVFEPRARLGGGLAYDTDEPVNRINVPAARMSLLPEDGEHFARWLRVTGYLATDPDAETADGHVFTRRSAFGRYVANQLAPLLASGAVEHHRGRVAAVTRQEGGDWRIAAADGTVLFADTVVIATTHPAPRAPAVLAHALAGHPGYIPDATVPGALRRIGALDRVLVVGAGLTAADVIAALDARGHRGLITAVSRRGLRARGHDLAAPAPFGNFTAPPARSARALLRRIRQTVAEAGAQDVGWHAVIDRVRAEGGTIWRALPLAEQRRLLRFLRPYWDAHRFRIAPQVEAVLEQRLAEGTLAFRAGSIAAAEHDAAGGLAVRLRLRLRLRHGGGFEDGRFDAVVVTTGPGHEAVLESQPYLSGLAAAGHVRADPVGLGLLVDEQSRSVAASGRPSGTLFVAGPLARGTFGELMGLPQVTEHAVLVARAIAASLPAAQVRAHG